MTHIHRISFVAFYTLSALYAQKLSACKLIHILLSYCRHKNTHSESNEFNGDARISQHKFSQRDGRKFSGEIVKFGSVCVACVCVIVYTKAPREQRQQRRVLCAQFCTQRRAVRREYSFCGCSCVYLSKCLLHEGMQYAERTQIRSPQSTFE